VVVARRAETDLRHARCDVELTRGRAVEGAGSGVLRIEGER
jgi:hypothetical protein